MEVIVTLQKLLKRMLESRQAEYVLVAQFIKDQGFDGEEDLEEAVLSSARSIKEAAEAIIETINDNTIEQWGKGD